MGQNLTLDAKHSFHSIEIPKYYRTACMTHNVKVNYVEKQEKEQVSAKYKNGDTTKSNNGIILVREWQYTHSHNYSEKIDKKFYSKHATHTSMMIAANLFPYASFSFRSQNETHSHTYSAQTQFAVIPFSIFHFLHRTLMHTHSVSRMYSWQ